MTKRKPTSPAFIATAIFVTATIKSRCRAGYVFTNEKETRIELDQLPAGGLAAIEADPYLKVTYETEDKPADEGTALQLELQEQAIKRAEIAEGRILELESELETAKERVAELEAHTQKTDKLLAEYEEQLAVLKDAKKAKAK